MFSGCMSFNFFPLCVLLHLLLFIIIIIIIHLLCFFAFCFLDSVFLFVVVVFVVVNLKFDKNNTNSYLKVESLFHFYFFSISHGAGQSISNVGGVRLLRLLHFGNGRERKFHEKTDSIYWRIQIGQLHYLLF